MFDLLDLDDNQCRYPVLSDASRHFFCGAVAKDGSSYCTEHAKICHWPNPPKMDWEDVYGMMRMMEKTVRYRK